MSKKALLVVDVQNDFCSKGSYPTPSGEDVIKPINKLLDFARENNWLIIFSRDWHPKGMSHCVQNTKGAEFHPDLKIKPADIVISKGIFDQSETHYSVFNGEDNNLEELFVNNQVDKVYIVGLVFDYCVKYTALDSAYHGFDTTIIKDATRGIYKKIMPDQLELELTQKGIHLINSDKIL